MTVGELTPKVRIELLDTLTNLVEAARSEHPKGLDVCWAETYHEKIYKMIIKYAYRTPLDKVMEVQQYLERSIDMGSWHNLYDYNKI